MTSIKIRYKRDKKIFVPQGEVDLPDNFEIELPEIKPLAPFDKDKLIVEVEETGKKYFPDFKLSDRTKKLLGILKDSPFRNLSDEELKRIYNENVWRSSDEKYNH